MVLMLVSCVLMSILIWYLDNVWPWQDGVPKPLWFPFTRNYWFPVQSTAKSTDLNEGYQDNPEYFERMSDDKDPAIAIRGLRKKFGKKYAVDGVNLDIAHGQITCLLGHNGAGKTTTMSMITGMFAADNGAIAVNGFDVSTQTKDARASMSLCPQHNVLYEELTVREHLRLYAAIKGMPWGETDEAAVKTAGACQLSHVIDSFPRQLSGGMKRKLCLSIALVGDTSVVILDEPTSGLDPEARRAIWDLLREVRRERTILLTTHFMEEADALGDTIAIMTAGRISCFGSPMFLKRAFSTGYQLRVAKHEGPFDSRVLLSLVQRHFSKGTIKSDIDQEVILTLESSNGQTDTSKLPAFLKDLEMDKAKLGIDAFGLSLTTLEDVFLKVGDMAEGHDKLKRTLSVNSNGDQTNGNASKESPRVSLDMDNTTRPIRVTGTKLNIQRFKGLMVKRLNYAKRYWPAVIFQMVVPSVVLGLCLFATNKLLSPSSSEAGILDIKTLYGATSGFYQTEDTPFLESFKSAAASSSIGLTSVPENDNIQNYLLDLADKTSLNQYINKHLFGAVAKRNQSDSRSYKLWYNWEALHALPAGINVFYEGLLRELSGNSNAQIEIASEPIESTSAEVSRLPSGEATLMIWLIFIPLSVPFLAASYAMFATTERESKAKLLQLMTGLNPGLFWFASFLFDLMSHLVTTGLIMIIFAAMDKYGIVMAHASHGCK